MKQLKLCVNCLCTGHIAKDCQSSSCRKCTSRHNTLFHENKVSNESPVALLSGDVNIQVLLSTAIVNVFDLSGKKRRCRALLDSGRQSHFITSNFCKRLRIKPKDVDISITGINKAAANINSKCNIKLQYLHTPFSSTIQCLILPQITGKLPIQSIDSSLFDIPSNIQLADVTFTDPGEIDLLIGASLFWDLIKPGRLSLGKNMPTLHNTSLRWVVCGPIQIPQSKSYCHFTSLSNLEGQLQKFWEVEACDTTTKPISLQDQFCEQHFLKTHSRNADGRFVVRIPFKNLPFDLGDSKSLPSKRMINLEKRFNLNSFLKTQYLEFMNEYIKLGHMSLVSDSNFASYILPHHAVFRNVNGSEKIRVVFDGSAKTDKQTSINAFQSTEPPIQNDIFDLFVRFRQHAFVGTADIEKIYRQMYFHLIISINASSISF